MSAQDGSMLRIKLQIKSGHRLKRRGENEHFMAIHLQSVELLRDQYPTGEHYPFTLDILRKTKKLEFDTPVTLFAGENGSGKSTLLEALTRGAGIHIWSFAQGTRFQVNRYEKLLHNCLSLKWTNGAVPGAFFGSETFRDFKRLLDEWAASDPGQFEYFGGKSLVTQSHGQSMMSYFRSRYQIKGIYLLDEPETALSPKSQLELLDLLGECSRAGHAQFIVATHSPILLACRGAKIYSFDHLPARVIKYEETEHYKLYSRFLLDRAGHH